MSSIDDIFKNRLYDHEEEVPSDMWNNILAAQHEEKKKRRFLFIWLFGGLISLAAIMGYFMFESRAVDQNLSRAEVVSSSKKSQDYTDLDNQVLSEDKNEKKSEVLVTEEGDNNKDNQKVVFNQSNTVSEKFATNYQYLNNASNQTKKGEISLLNSSQDKIFNDVVVNSYNSQEEISQNLINNAISKDNTSNLNKLLSTTMLGSGYLNNLNLPEMSFDQSFMKKRIQRVDCPRFNRTKGAFFIEGLYGVNLNIKRLTSKSGIQSNSYLLKRIESERALYSSSGILKVGYQFPVGISFASGVEYGQITERFSYEDLDAIKTKTVITFDTTFLSNGSFTTKADTFRLITHGSEVTRIVNRYRSLDIPLSLGYSIKGKQLDVVLKASALLNVYFQPSGKVLGVNDKPISIHNLDIDEGLEYTNRLKTRFDIAVGFNYHLSRNFDLILEPYFKTSTGDITGSDYELSQSYSTFGLRTGVKYILK